MNLKDHRRRVPLYCPTCGGTDYEFEDDVQDSMARLKCVSCEREITRKELISENQVNINQHAAEMNKEISQGFQKELRSTLKKAFSGSKHVKFR